MSGPHLYPFPKGWRPEEGTTDTSRFACKADFETICTLSADLHDEGYRIVVTSGAVCRAELGSRAALHYAWRHFQQLQGGCPNVTPCGILEDEPVCGRRAFMLDISRCKVPTRDGFRQWLKVLSGLRFNELQLYTEHTFAYSGHEHVWKNASPLTAEDIIWIQQEAKKVGITLVPNQNCFGHFERWIKHDHYRKYAEAPDGFESPWGGFRPVGTVLKPDDASFALVSGLLDELLPLFESGRVNIGCDETFDLGQGASKARCKQEGTGAVYAEFVNRIMTHVEEKHGRQPEFWGDILLKYPEEIRKLSPNATALCWGYEADSPLQSDCDIYAASGYPFTVCPGTSSWRSFAGRTDNMISNITVAAKAAVQTGADGMLLTDWGDCGHLQQEPVSYGPMALFALKAWQGPDAPESLAWDWCDHVAFQGHAGDTTRWLEAGRISEHTGIRPGNATMLFQWFLSPDHEKGQKVSDATLENIQARIDRLQAPTAFKEEWEQTLLNLRLSLKLVTDTRKGTAFSKPLLKEAREAHSRLWRKRNREGGLAESLEHYI